LRGRWRRGWESRVTRTRKNKSTHSIFYISDTRNSETSLMKTRAPVYPTSAPESSEGDYSFHLFPQSRSGQEQGRALFPSCPPALTKTASTTLV
jgi:hypothetical protein